MIDKNQAIKNSIEYLNEIYNTTKDDLKVEEIELSDNEKLWIITLGWDESEKINSLVPITTPFASMKRSYKTFFVDSENGVVKKMKIWKGDYE